MEKRRGVGPSYRKHLLRKSRGQCTYCLTKLTHRTNWWPGGARPTDFQIDHVIPVCKGGMDDVPNMRAVCTRCNKKKYKKLPFEWVEYLKEQRVPYADRVERVIKLHISRLYKPGQVHLYNGDYEKYIRKGIN